MFQGAVKCAHLTKWVVVACLFGLNLEVRGCGGLTAGCRVCSIEWSRSESQRERGHFSGVSHCGERPGSLPAGLTALSRNVCDWRPGWGCALSCSLCKQSKEAERCVLCRRLWCGVSTYLPCVFISFPHCSWPHLPFLKFLHIYIYLHLWSHKGIDCRELSNPVLIFWVCQFWYGNCNGIYSYYSSLYIISKSVAHIKIWPFTDSTYP